VVRVQAVDGQGEKIALDHVKDPDVVAGRVVAGIALHEAHVVPTHQIEDARLLARAAEAFDLHAAQDTGKRS
jgi:hypothetical protein